MQDGLSPDWQAQFNSEFTEVTVKLRKGVEWSDASPSPPRTSPSPDMLAAEATLNNGAGPNASSSTQAVTT
jgi:ABC-type transport system substrate-binding protein